MTLHARRPDPARLLLGVLLARPEHLASVRDLLCEFDFYSEEHRRIWRAILAVSDEGAPTVEAWHVRIAWHLSHEPEGSAAVSIATLLDPAELADAGMLPLDPSKCGEWAGEIRNVRRKLMRVVQGGT